MNGATARTAQSIALFVAMVAVLVERRKTSRQC